MTGAVSHARLLAQPLPDDLSAAHAMIRELRSLLEEHRASFGELDRHIFDTRARHLKAGLTAHVGGDLAPSLRTPGVVRGACRLLVFMADNAVTGGGRFIGFSALGEAAGYGASTRDYETLQAERNALRVAVSQARRLLDVIAPAATRGDIESLSGVGYRLHPRAARAVLDLEALGARAVPA